MQFENEKEVERFQIEILNFKTELSTKHLNLKFVEDEKKVLEKKIQDLNEKIGNDENKHQENILKLKENYEKRFKD